MLPPVEPTLLSANPRFSTLYHDLCTHHLHPDGTSKVSPDTKPRSSIEEDLRALRLATARREILQARLRGLAYGGEGQGLSGELQDLAALAAAALGTDDVAAEEDDRELVRRELEGFKDHAPPLAHALQHRLQHTRSLLPPLPPPQDPLRTTLHTSRLRLASRISDLQVLHRRACEACVGVLEACVHGCVARGLRARVEVLALVAEGLAGKVLVGGEGVVRGVDWGRVLGGMERDLRRRIRDAEEKLEAYGRVRGVEALGREYAEIIEEKERVGREIERLEGR